MNKAIILLITIACNNINNKYKNELNKVIARGNIKTVAELLIKGDNANEKYRGEH